MIPRPSKYAPKKLPFLPPRSRWGDLGLINGRGNLVASLLRAQLAMADDDDDESGEAEPVESPGAPGGGMPLPAAVRRPRRGGVAQGFSEPPASLVRCIGPWDGDEAGDIPIYRRGRSPSGRYPTARAQMRCRRGVWRPRAAQPSARPRSNCRDRPLLCREAHVHEGQQWTRWWLREVSSHFSQERRTEHLFAAPPMCFRCAEHLLVFLRAHLGTRQQKCVCVGSSLVGL